MSELLAVTLLPRNLYATLRVIQLDVLNKVECLNLGGCGVFAVAVAKELKKRSIPCEIITVGGKKNSPRKVKDRLANASNDTKDYNSWDSNGLSRNHVGVRFKDKGIIYTYDSVALLRSSKKFGNSGDSPWVCSYPYGEGMSISDMNKLTKSKDGWNTDFDRSQIDTVKNIVKDSFNLFY